MAYTTIKKPSSYFNTVLYTGDGTSPRSITGVGFQPDFLWIKDRSTAYEHRLMDAVRGSNKVLFSSASGAELSEEYYTVSSFDSDGWTGRSGTGTNQVITGGNDNGDNFVAWNWLGSNTTASNTNGSITSTVSANTTAGFSIVTWSGSGTNDQTIGHGLGVAPSFIIHKNRTYGSGAATGHWIVKTKEKINSSGTGSILSLNQTTAYSDNVHGTLIPSGSTLLQVKGGSGSPSDFWVNASGSNYVAYCFAEKQGYSKFGSYTGNGSTDGTFVYTGFKPAFLLVKCSSLIKNWYLIDNKRENYNPNHETSILFASYFAAEQTLPDRAFDFLSNGFKLRGSDNDFNGSGSNYIFMAFAEEPLVGDNPATAR